MAPASMDKIQALLTPVVEQLGFDLEAVEITRAGNRSAIAVIVDRDGGIDLDVVASVSRAVSEVLDESDLSGTTAYVLEVSSPGISRPLSLARHWRRNVSRLVEVARTDGSAVTGRIIAADEESVELERPEGNITIPFVQVDRAIVQIEFNRRGGEDN